MKKYLTASNVVVALLLIGIVMQVIVIFFPKKQKEQDPVMLQQIEQLTEQLRLNDEANKARDSMLVDQFHRNEASREIQLSKAKKTANEKIDHINSTDFTADSIKRYFANN